jgi:hypothetical protein
MAFHFFHLWYNVILGLNLSPGAVFHMSAKQIMEVFFTNFIQWAGTNKSYALRSCQAGFLSALVCHAPFSFRLLVIHKTKYNSWIIGKHPRSVANIYLETLFVTKQLYESSPPPQRLGQISGGPYVECFC